MNKTIIPTVIVALIVFAAIGFYVSQQNNAAPAMQETSTQSTAPAASSAMTEGTYKDGTYSVTGNYVSPGGPRTLEVSVTLENGVITETETEVTATDATSKRFQEEFVEGYKATVVGKNIDEVTLTKVAGSSLSPKGFNDALTRIRAEAKS